MDAQPRLLLAARLLFVLSGLLMAAGVVCLIGGALGATEIADRLLERLMAEIDPDTLASLPPDFLTSAMVQRAATALGVGLLLLGGAQLATSMALRRVRRWSFSAAVIGGLFVVFAAGATAVFMLVAIPGQPQAALPLTIGAVVLGLVAALYGAIAYLTVSGRRVMESASG